MAASPIEVPTTLPLPVLSQATNEIFPVAGSGKAGTMEAKAWKISKEKLKAILAAIDNMEDEEMAEVNYDPCNTHHISSSTNPGTSSLVNMSLLNPIAREEVFYQNMNLSLLHHLLLQILSVLMINMTWIIAFFLGNLTIVLFNFVLKLA